MAPLSEWTPEGGALPSPKGLPEPKLTFGDTPLELWLAVARSVLLIDDAGHPRGIVQSCNFATGACTQVLWDQAKPGDYPTEDFTAATWAFTGDDESVLDARATEGKSWRDILEESPLIRVPFEVD
jgi:hypothetical protein